MAKPRVFISSTFYDLKQIREDLERAIRDLGYESIRNETGSIPYGMDEPLEAYAMKELSLCDILVSIVGNRFGTESRQKDGHSISQIEVKTALDRDIPVFLFVERNLLAEHKIYKLNKDNPAVKYGHADDVRIHQFLEYILALPNNNPVAPFEVSADITEYLKLQWAGLFHRFLQDQKRRKELDVLKQMEGVAATLQNLVNFLTEGKKDSDAAVRNILMANHPAFGRIAKLLDIPFRVYFTDVEELDALVRQFGWYGSNLYDESDPIEWVNERGDTLTASRSIFDGKRALKIFAGDWSDDWIDLDPYVPPPPRRSAPPPNGQSSRRPAPASTPSGQAPRRPAPQPETDDDIPF